MGALQIELIIAAFVFFLFIINSLKKNRMSVKSSVAWMVFPLVCLLIAIFPTPMAMLASWLGFQAFSNFIFLVLIVTLIVLCFFLTVIVSNQQEQIKRITQEVSILKKEQDDEKKKRS